MIEQQLERVHRSLLRGLMLMVVVASLMLTAAEGFFLPTGLTPFFAIAMWYFNDRRQLFHIPVFVANILGLLALVATSGEFWLGGERRLLAGCHLLVYLTWITLMMRKGTRQYWWLTALCLLQVSVGSVLTGDAGFAFSLVLLMGIVIWTLSVFCLERTRSEVGGIVVMGRNADDLTQRAGAVERRPNLDPAAGNGRRNATDRTLKELSLSRLGVQLDDGRKWLDARFHATIALAVCLSLVQSALVFSAFPRTFLRESPLRWDDDSGGAPKRTGFSGQVKLGEIGEILSSDGREMTIEVFDARTDAPVTMEDFAMAMSMEELLLRGTSLSQYRNGVWSIGSGNLPMLYRQKVRNDFVGYRFHIIHHPPLTETVFAPHPNEAVRFDEQDSGVRQLMGESTFLRSDKVEPQTDGSLSYNVWCRGPERAGTLTFRSWRDLTESRRVWRARQGSLTPNVRIQLPLLARLADEQTADPDSRLPLSDQEKAERIVAWLRDSGEFSYTMVQDVEDRSIDPVEDFLVNRKAGHCEYFASAAALMLQASDIPARVVNGFKGVHLNSMTGRYEVQHRHAHSWIEAFYDDEWHTLDPTPATARSDSVASTVDASFWSDLRFMLNDFWSGSVLRMSSERQTRMAQPMIDLFNDLKGKVEERGLWGGVKAFFAELWNDPGSWFSWKGGVATFVLLLLVAGAWKSGFLTWLLTLLPASLTFGRRQGPDARTVVAFYERFVATCRANGLPVSRHQTAREVAAAASQQFSDRLDKPELQDIPKRIADTFNLVRFGSDAITPEITLEMSDQLSRLTTALSASPHRA